jgi:hypothetical protein
MAKDIRGELRTTAEDVDLAAFFREAVNAEKQTTCPKCRTGVTIPDWSARARVIQLLLEQGYGKAPTQTDGPAVDLAEDPARWTPTERAHAATHISKLAKLTDTKSLSSSPS